jgi:hypothetical protein
MKKTTLLVILFALVFASPSYAEWENVAKSKDGTTFYVDYERIRKHDGYVYWWLLQDLLKPTKYGDLSQILYQQGDCKVFRYKILSYVFHKQPMGLDIGESSSPENPKWDYPRPGGGQEAILKSVCSK